MTPTFSIVIPTYNRPEELERCLAALCELDYGRERFEVIVVNDAGNSIETVVAPFAERMSVTGLLQKHSGPAGARNTGAARAQGKYIAFTDDDCRPAPAWLSELERALDAGPDVLAGGDIVNTLEDNAYSAASQLLVAYLYSYYNSARGRARFLASNNMAMAKDAFITAGGFDARFPLAAAEDRELCDRWRAAGRRIVYAPAALVRHAHRLTPRSFWLQHFHYGQGAHRFRRANARRGAAPAPMEPLSFYWNLVRYPWTARACHPIRTGALLALAQTANTLGFFCEKVGSLLRPA